MRDSIVIAVLSLFLGFVIGYLYFERNNLEQAERVLNLKIDTVVKFVPAEPLVIEKIRTKLIYRSDTIVRTQAFVATVDTILQMDTIYARYEFPENLFSLNLRRGGDSLRTVMIKTEVAKSGKRDWWESPAIGIAGVVIGYLVRSCMR